MFKDEKKKFYPRGLALAALATGLCIGLAGCGDDDDVRAEVGEKVAEIEVNDQWKSECKNVPLDIFNVASRTERFDIGASLTLESTFYAQDNCQDPVFTVKEVGSYTLGDKVGDDKYAFDKRYESAMVTPLNEKGRDLLNTLNACGVNDWQVGAGRDVTAATSNNPLDRCWSEVPRQVYDIVQLSVDELWFGLETSDLDKSAPTKRPLEVDAQTKFTRD